MLDPWLLSAQREESGESFMFIGSHYGWKRQASVAHQRLFRGKGCESQRAHIAVTAASTIKIAHAV